MSDFFSDPSRQFASPIHFPPFTYNRHSGLEANRHARCASDCLHALLTYTDPGPALTKQGKPRVQQPRPHRNESAGFYQAQLVHHGLKPLKTKGPAKNALLAAIQANNGTLAVPENILRLERDLAAQLGPRTAVARRETYAERERERAAEELKAHEKEEGGRGLARGVSVDDIVVVEEEEEDEAKSGRQPPSRQSNGSRLRAFSLIP